MRRTACLAALAVTFGLAAATPAAAVEGDTAVTLPVTRVDELLVTDDRVYVTAGGSSGLLVRNRAGGAIATIANQPGAGGLALSPDGSTLYVALRLGDAISAIDTVTLTEKARYATGAGTCPGELVMDGTKLWFGHGCDQWGGGIGVVDFSGDAPVVNPDLVGLQFYGAPEVDVAGDRLVVAEYGIGPMTLYTYDIDGATLTPALSRRLDGFLRDLDVTDDDEHVLIATGNPYYHQRYRISDLSSSGAYGTHHPYPNAVEADGGHVAAGTDASYGTDIRIYKADGTLVRAYETGMNLVAGALAWAPDGQTLYAVSGSYFDDPVVLHVLRDPKRTTSAISLTAPTAPGVDEPFTVGGTLTTTPNPPPPGTAVKVTRQSRYGTVALGEVHTTANGAFTIADTVSQRGTYTYTATFEGSDDNGAASKSVSFHVTGLTPSLTVSTNVTAYGYQSTATVIASLGSGTANRVVRISAKPYGQVARVLSSGDVNASGDRTTSWVVDRRTTFTASFAGDDRYEPRSATVTVTAKAGLRQALSGHYGTSGSYRLYRATANPVIGVTVAPVNAGACADFDLQRYVSGAWQAVASSGCVPLDASSRASALYDGARTKGVPYRMRSRFTGNTRNAATTGAWLYLKFTT